MPSVTIWGIHAGEFGEAHDIFMGEQFIAIGWKVMGDLSALPPNREAFKAAYCTAYPHKRPSAARNKAGQAFRFACEMAYEDLVVYASKADQQINIGIIAGDYLYQPWRERFVSLRSVRWLKAVPRSQF